MRHGAEEGGEACYVPPNLRYAPGGLGAVSYTHLTLPTKA